MQGATTRAQQRPLVTYRFRNVGLGKALPGGQIMPSFISKTPMARLGLSKQTHTAWQRRFAWYPVTDMNITYWLMWLDWRKVTSSGSIAGRPVRGDYIEYRVANSCDNGGSIA
jgi:hypothetical protein